MESEKVKEIKKVLEEGQFNTINHHQKEGKPIKISFADILTLINELECENEKLKQHKRELQGGQRDLSKAIKEFDKENQQLKDRIVELEEYIKGNEQDAKAFVNGWHKDLKTELKQFAERIKMEFYYQFDELIPSIMADKIDETLKEFVNG